MAETNQTENINETLNELNKFRHEPSSYQKQFETQVKAIRRIKKNPANEALANELEAVTNNLSSFPKFSPFQLDKGLNKAAEEEIEKIMKNPPKNAHKPYSEIVDLVNKYCCKFNKLAMILDHGSLDSLMSRLFISTYDPSRHNKESIVSNDFFQVGVATAYFNDDILRVFILADFVEDISHDQNDHEFYFDDLSDLKKAFDYFDVNKSGLLDAKELKSCLRAVGYDLDNPTIFNLISSLDTEENDKGIDFKTFAIAFDKTLGNDRTKDGLFKLFTLFIDNPHQYVITESSVRRLCKEVGERLSDNEAKEIIDRASSNGKELEFEEFYSIMTGA